MLGLLFFKNKKKFLLDNMFTNGLEDFFFEQDFILYIYVKFWKSYYFYIAQVVRATIVVMVQTIFILFFIYLILKVIVRTIIL